MFRKHVQPGATQTAAQRAAAAGHPAGSALRPVKPVPGPATTARSCCCPAKPQVKVIMPATATRPPVDLWLCGHHYRACSAALAQAGAAVQTLGPDAADWLTSAALPGHVAG
jgi:hypothetical protein